MEILATRNEGAVNAGGAVPARMRAAVYHKPGSPFSLEEVDTPGIRPSEVLIKVHACGVIPNLMTILENFHNFPTMHAPKLPAIYGLDAAGEIVAKGELVHEFEIGDRVYVNPARTCGSCRNCRLDREYACDYFALNGYFGMGPKAAQTLADHPYGAFAEYMPAPQSSLVKLPDNLSFNTVVRFGYFGTAYSAIRQGGVNMSTTLLVNGATGTLGLGAVAFGLGLGVPKILAVGRDPALLEKLKSLAPHRIETHSTRERLSVEEWARGLTDGAGADVVFDALPTGASTDAFMGALAALARGGRHVNASGVYGNIPIDPLEGVIAVRTMISSNWFSTAEGQQMADLVGSGVVDLSFLEHEVFALDDINKALPAMTSRHGGFTNFVISPLRT